MSAPPGTSITVPTRFRGPASSGNGGWTAGAVAVATAAPGPVEVTLRRPPPLERRLAVTAGDGEWSVLDGDALVAVARTVSAHDDRLAPVPGTAVEAAAAAESSYAGLSGHPFPTCFSCGPERPVGDGLRIFPGRLADDTGRVAATWIPHESLVEAGVVPAPVVWAALDCVGGWASDLDERPMVLGRMTAVVDALPRPGAPHVVVGQVRALDGRRTHTASALYDPDGRLLARAAHVWFAVDPAAFG